MSGPSIGRREALTADGVLCLVTAIWGSTFVVNRLVLETTPPLLFLTARFGLGGLVLLLLASRKERTPGLLRDTAMVGALLAASIGLQIVGQLYTTASKAAFITGLSVPLTPVAGVLLTGKHPSRENLFGLAIAVAGFALLSWPSGGGGIEVGDLLVLGAAIIYAVIIVLLAEAAPRHDPRWYAAGQILFAAGFVAVARLALHPFLSRPGSFFAAEGRPVVPAPRLLAALLWMALLATVVSFLLQIWAQARMQATHAALLFALEPVWTAVFAALALGERFGPREGVGALLVLLGILVSELRWSRS